MEEITQIKIHPAIGIARLGNHPTASFDGPQKPFEIIQPNGGYKKDGKIKRQAAVFRLFGYDQNGHLVKEITSADAEIEWRVDLANKKASWREFAGLSPNRPLRNSHAPAGQRARLNVHPTPKSVNPIRRSAKLDDGTFTDWDASQQAKTARNILLGEIKMDTDGRLRVLGGFGKSRSPYDKVPGSYANNDGWCDDASDGPVNATVTLSKGNQTFEAVGAWVICAPPKFAPGIRHVVTLYDVLVQNAVDRGELTEVARPSFAYDVYPILKAALDVQWVYDHAHPFAELLRPNSDLALRRAVVQRLRRPNGAGPGNMPRLLGDDGRPGVAMTQVQYNIMKKWESDDIKKSGIHGQPPVPPVDIDPAGLDRAALESCVGGGFYPGIEVSWFMRDVYEMTPGDPFRLNPVQSNPQQPMLTAGDVTKQLAVPWQADFSLCRQEQNHGWWPPVRPDIVRFASTGSTGRWAGTTDRSYLSMVQEWPTRSFVVPDGSGGFEAMDT